MNQEQYNQLPKDIQECWEWDEDEKEYFQSEGMNHLQMQAVVAVLNKH